MGNLLLVTLPDIAAQVASLRRYIQHNEIQEVDPQSPKDELVAAVSRHWYSSVSRDSKPDRSIISLQAAFVKRARSHPAQTRGSSMCVASHRPDTLLRHAGAWTHETAHSALAAADVSVAALQVVKEEMVLYNLVTAFKKAHADRRT